MWSNLDSKVHGANMGPTWVLSAPGVPYVGPMNLALWEEHCHAQQSIADLIWRWWSSNDLSKPLSTGTSFDQMNCAAVLYLRGLPTAPFYEGLYTKHYISKRRGNKVHIHRQHMGRDVGNMHTSTICRWLCIYIYHFWEIPMRTLILKYFNQNQLRNNWASTSISASQPRGQ